MAAIPVTGSILYRYGTAVDMTEPASSDGMIRVGVVSAVEEKPYTPPIPLSYGNRHERRKQASITRSLMKPRNGYRFQ